MKDFILDISFDARDAALEELVQSRLYLTPSTGSSSSEVNGRPRSPRISTTPISATTPRASSADIDGIELH